MAFPADAIAAVANAMPQMPSLPDISGIGSIGTTPPATGVTGATGTPATGGTDFGTLLSQGIDSLEATQNTASTLAVQAATGDLTSIQDYTVAATEASVATQLAVTLRNQAVSAFNQIMNMQV